MKDRKHSEDLVPVIIIILFVLLPILLTLGTHYLTSQPDEIPNPALEVFPNSGGLPDAPIAYLLNNAPNVIHFFDPGGNSTETIWIRPENSEDLQQLTFFITSDTEGDIWVRTYSGYGNPLAGDPIEIRTSGEILRCEDVPYGDNRIPTLGDDRFLAVVHQEDRSTDLIEYDLSSCAYGETLLSVDDYVYEAFRSVSGFWAIWREAQAAHFGDIDIYSPAGEFLYTIENASYPTWAHNSDILTFVRDVQDHRTFHDQIWIFEQDISREELIIEMDDTYEQPVVWSPDDTHLLFYQADGFYFYELNGGDVTVYACDPGRAVWR